MIFNTLKEKFRGRGIVAPKVRTSILLLALLVAAGSCKMELDGASSSEDTNSGGAAVIWTVTFEPQGGNFDGSEDAVSKTTNSKSRISVLPQPEKEGVTFAGWHIEDDIDSPQFTSATIVSKNMTVYAAWANEVKTVTFWTLNDEGELEEFSETRIAPPQTTVVLEESPLRAGYAFAGWYTITQPDILITNKEDAAAGTADVEYERSIPTQNQFFLGHTVVIDGMQIYALWQERLEDAVMITFEAYPGNVVKNLFALGFHDWRIPDSSTIPATGTRPHYNPQDSGTWFLPDGSEFTKNSSEEDADGTQFLKEDGDVVLHANWTGKTYRVRFMLGDTTDNEYQHADVTYPANTVTLPAAMPDRGSAYMNDGKWYTSGNIEFTEETVVIDNIDLSPRWATGALGLTSIGAKYGSLSANLTQITDTTYTCSLPSFVESVVVQAVSEGPDGTTVIFDPADKTINSWGGSDNKTVTITVNSGLDSATKVYTVTFAKRSEVETQMASGGAVTFIKNGTDDETATWDEVHTFTTAGPDQLVFNEANPNIDARILLVAGGGGGGGGIYLNNNHRGGGGGGGGGVVHKENYSITEKTNAITVGAGGANGNSGTSSASQPTNGTNGSDSIFTSTDTLKALGGGGGGRLGDGASSPGLTGGSSGGSTWNNSPVETLYWTGTANDTATGESSPSDTRQGNKGGGSTSANDGSAGGGGGAGAAGGAGTTSNGGAGGQGWACDITGTNTYYAGGGGGGIKVVGGSTGSPGANGNGTIGQGGRGGIGTWGSYPATAGETGIVIVRFPFSE
ncbi:MAG: hypothetical protein Ta2F_01280 [Termitinemataceae bacterium]|nr:MAG: hypothetical protein Ta2F_01280 [Termitinemataceae bacterium]